MKIAALLLFLLLMSVTSIALNLSIEPVSNAIAHLENLIDRRVDADLVYCHRAKVLNEDGAENCKSHLEKLFFVRCSDGALFRFHSAGHFTIEHNKKYNVKVILRKLNNINMSGGFNEWWKLRPRMTGFPDNLQTFTHDKKQHIAVNICP